QVPRACGHPSRAAGGTGRRARLRGVWGNPSGFESRAAHHLTSIKFGVMAPAGACETVHRRFSTRMELYEVMRTTGSTRRFLTDPVPDAVLYRVLDNARFAASGGNRQG